MFPIERRRFAACGVSLALLLIPFATADSPPDVDVTGLWTSNEGTLYYIRQLGTTLWWAGFNPDPFSPIPVLANSFHRGIFSAQVFRGTIASDTVTGDWAEVPRQATPNLRNGTLQLLIRPGGAQIHVQSQSGGLQLTDLTRSAIPSLPCTDPVGNRDPYCLFAKVLKNQTGFTGSHESLLDNLKPYKDNTVVFATVSHPLELISPFDKTSTCADFFRVNADDGDLTLDVSIDRANLDSQPGFWTDGWINNSSHILGKLTFLNNALHTESIMFGRANADCKPGDPVFLPGWAEANANGTLFQGIPIASNVLRSASSVGIAGYAFPFGPGSRVRITGPIALDCGHGLGNPCHETENDPNNNDTKNLEIHPIYAIDALQDYTLARPHADLTGTWAASDVGTYYVRQIGNTVWWLGLSRDQGIAFANVFKGAVQAGAPPTIKGDWATVPLGQSQNNGTLTLSGVFCPGLTNDQLPCQASAPAAQWNLIQTQADSDPTFGKPPIDIFQWKKLYDRNRETVPHLVAPQSISLGVIGNGGEGSGNLVLSNAGNAQLQIQSVKPSLTALKVSPQTLNIDPLSSGSVHLTWLISTDTKPGKIVHTATLRILSNDVTSPSLEVSVELAVNGGKAQ